jgi:cyclic AMP-dependent transcription factor ATF-4
MDTSTLTMESLALPTDLYWNGKTEPISPSSEQLFSNDLSDTLAYDYSFTNGLPFSLLDDDLNTEDKEIIELTTYELTNGDDVVMELTYSLSDELKEECLLETKLLDYPTGIEVAHPHTVIKVQNPTDDGIYCATGFDTSLAQLTPPQSPPQNSAASSPVYQQNHHGTETQHNNTNNINFTTVLAGIPSPSSAPQSAPASPSIHTASNIIPNVLPNTVTFTWPGIQVEQAQASPNQHHHQIVANPSNDYNEDFERDMQILDEIVNNRAKELPEWNALDESETQSSFSAPSQADSDWQPESCYSSNVSSPLYQHSGDEKSGLPSEASLASLSYTSSPSASPCPSAADSSMLNIQTGASFGDGTTKKRTRQYGRGTEDRKIRKKEQNKNAATRYRQKKKQEMESILVEEQLLLQRHNELKRILADTNREAKYLKSLIREFFLSDGK